MTTERTCYKKLLAFYFGYYISKLVRMILIYIVWFSLLIEKRIALFYKLMGKAVSLKSQTSWPLMPCFLNINYDFSNLPSLEWLPLVSEIEFMWLTFWHNWALKLLLIVGVGERVSLKREKNDTVNLSISWGSLLYNLTKIAIFIFFYFLF